MDEQCGGKTIWNEEGGFGPHTGKRWRDGLLEKLLVRIWKVALLMLTLKVQCVGLRWRVMVSLQIATNWITPPPPPHSGHSLEPLFGLYVQDVFIVLTVCGWNGCVTLFSWPFNLLSSCKVLCNLGFERCYSNKILLTHLLTAVETWRGKMAP